MGLNLGAQYGQTPLEEEEKEGLLIKSIATKEELDEFEQQNIEQALLWTMSRKMKPEVLFSEKFMCRLHKEMFGEVWKWGGKFRTSEKNLGIESWKISIDLKTLCDDALFWVKNEVYSPDETAIRFKHRLVSIHCLPNGNGRHSRLLADLIAEKIFGVPPFSWGMKKDSTKSSRQDYLKAIKLADQNIYEELIKFARS